MALPSVVNRMKFSTARETLPKPAFKRFEALRAGNWIEEKGKVTTDIIDFQSKDGVKTMPHTDRSFVLYQAMYQKVPIVKCSIDSTANFAIQSGYELEGPSVHVERIKKWIDKVNADLIMLDAMKQMQIYGNAWMEITDVEKPKFLPVNQMYVVVYSGEDNDGEIKNYKQMVKTGEEGTDFEFNEMVHFIWNRESGLNGGFYGLSDLKASVNVLENLLNFQEDIGAILHKVAAPVVHWKLGTEDSPATTTQISNFESMLDDRDVGGNIITSANVEGTVVAANLKMVQPDGMIKHLENQLISALQVPEIFVRGGETSNKATADVELQAFDRRVKALRSVVSTYFEDIIFPKITGTGEGKVKIVWNEPSFETEAKKAEMIKNLSQGGMPLEVAMKVVGWGAFINDLNEAGGEKQPMMAQNGPDGQDKPDGKSPEKPKPKEKPKEEDFEIQADYYEAMKTWKAINRG